MESSDEFSPQSPSDEDSNALGASPTSSQAEVADLQVNDPEVFARGTLEDGLHTIGSDRAVVIVPPGTTLVKALREVLTPEYYQEIYKNTNVGKKCSLKDKSTATHFPPYERKLENNPHCPGEHALSMKGFCWEVTRGKKLLGYKLADLEQCLKTINPRHRSDLEGRYSEGSLR